MAISKRKRRDLSVAFTTSFIETLEEFCGTKDPFKARQWWEDAPDTWLEHEKQAWDMLQELQHKMNKNIEEILCTTKTTPNA